MKTFGPMFGRMGGLALALFLVFLQAGPAWAGLDEAYAAYRRGDYEATLRELRPLAEQGLAEAQFDLAAMYNFGEGVPQDYAEAVRWTRMAAEQGLAEAQIHVGLMYHKAQGVPQDDVLAHMWLNLAISQLPPGEERDVAIRFRDVLARRMTPDQLAETQRPPRR